MRYKKGGKMRTVIQNIDLIRQSKKISKKDFADGIGISAMAYSRLSNGQTKLSSDLIIKISLFLKIRDMNIFFDEKLTDSVINNNNI